MLGTEDDFVALGVSLISRVFYRAGPQSLAELPISKGKYFAPYGSHALVVPPAGWGEAIRVAEKVIGPDLEISRVLNMEIPGSSLIMVTRSGLVQE
jgi:hypothetical protein